MKSTTVKSFQRVVSCVILLLIFVFISSTTGSTNKGSIVSNKTLKPVVLKDSGVSGCKNIFLILGTSVATFLKIVDKGGFKRMICQFRNTGFNTKENGFEYDVISYAWKSGLLRRRDYFDSLFMKPLPERGVFDNFSMPYCIGNLELRHKDIKDFIANLKKNLGKANGYDSVLFVPFVHDIYGRKYINLKLVPIKSGQELKSEMIILANSSFDPSPPAKPQIN